jgi:hypothetical protein
MGIHYHPTETTPKHELLMKITKLGRTQTKMATKLNLVIQTLVEDTTVVGIV